MKKILLFVGLLFFLTLTKNVNAQDSGICVSAPSGPFGPYQSCHIITIPQTVFDAGQCKRAGAEVGLPYQVCCKPQTEPGFPENVCSVYNLREPVCGSADYGTARMMCGYETWGLMCWGNNYRTPGLDQCSTDPAFPEPSEFGGKYTGYLNGNGGSPTNAITQDLTTAQTYDSIQYNGITYNAIGNKPVCVCSDAVPGGCQCPGVAIAGGEGESRLWFPHLKLIAALSTMAQAIFNPQPSTLANNAPPSDQTASLTNAGVVTTRIEKHQGADDPTIVVNTETNNSSLITTYVAPKAEDLKSYAQPPYDQMACVVPEVKNNPGDDLVGPKIVGRVLFTQKYDYEACPKKWLTGSCVADGGVATSPASCCSQQNTDPQCHAEAIDNLDGTFRCGAPPQVERQTEGKAAVYIKNPLVEYIYDVMVNGSQSLFKRFIPYDSTRIFDEIPSSVAYNASAISNNEGGAGVELKTDDGNAPSFYVPHIGSLKKYWLEDLQKALRPQNVGYTAPSVPTPGPSTAPAGNCTAPEPESAELENILANATSTGAAAKVPKSVLDWIYRIEALPFYTGHETYTCSYKNIYLGLMAMGDPAYNLVVPEAERPATEERQCIKQDGKLNRCWPIDSMEITARLLLSKIGEYPNGRITTAGEVRRSTCGYYGGDQPDIYTKNFANGHFSDAQCRDGNCDNMSYADIVCLGSGFCNGTTWPKRLGDNPATPDVTERCFQSP